MIKVGVFGAGGRMGSMVCRTVAADADLELVAAIDPAHAGVDVSELTGAAAGGVQIAPTPAGLADAGAEVAVDFTQAAAARENLRFCADHNVHAVVGTTGLGPDDLETLEGLFPVGDGPNCVVAPNFAIGAVLMMRFAELAAPWFETAEIIELHHDAKVDAPSGTAMLTAERMTAASSEWGDDPTRDEVLTGARGGVRDGGPIHVHSVRLKGLVAHQEVLLGTTGQSLTIRHDSYDRSSFMPGVVLAIKEIGRRSGLTVGLDSLLGL
jgi:4-hydroxy-tetrahydrodipicolinate reductase